MLADFYEKAILNSVEREQNKSPLGSPNGPLGILELVRAKDITIIMSIE